ncbi:unnamed protein product [Moneuplotes crassus]|uniref:Uncharacterized protein n=1 Tax=Euplotes crassus TaxID=5936 RepID=A0AAD1U4N6_EUPCR|nr:unnamed protein product [Moneuplotes crassus]
MGKKKPRTAQKNKLAKSMAIKPPRKGSDPLDFQRPNSDIGSMTVERRNSSASGLVNFSQIFGAFEGFVQKKDNKEPGDNQNANEPHNSSEAISARVLIGSQIFVILLCMLSYGIYILLGDCFSSMLLAFVTSLYLRDVKLTIQKSISQNLASNEKSLLMKILMVRFIMSTYKNYKIGGLKGILSEICAYIFNFVTSNFDRRSSTLFNDVPKIMTICALYILLRYFGIKVTLLIFIIFLGIDLALKSLAWLIMIAFCCCRVRSKDLDDKDTRYGGFLSVVISYALITIMLLMIIGSCFLLSFLLLLDLNYLRQNNMESISLSNIVDENSLIIGRVDTAVKPYLKKLLKLLHHQTNIPYEFEKERFKNMTTLQVLSDFTKATNISSPGDLFTLYQNFELESSDDEKNDDPSDFKPEDFETTTEMLIRNYNKVSELVSTLFKDKKSNEMNTAKIYENV